LGARAYTSSFRGCSCHPSDSKSHATVPDEVPAELFKAEGETVLDRMHRIRVTIWETGEWPEEWTFSAFIPLPKKGDLKQCANYRTIIELFHMQARSFFGSYWKGSE